MKTLTRTVLRFALDDRDIVDGLQVAKVTVPAVTAPLKVVRVGAGTSPRVCAWIEMGDAREVPEADGAATLTLRFAFVPTGGTIPDDAAFLATVLEDGPTGHVLLHVYSLLG